SPGSSDGRPTSGGDSGSWSHRDQGKKTVKQAQSDEKSMKKNIRDRRWNISAAPTAKNRVRRKSTIGRKPSSKARTARPPTFNAPGQRSIRRNGMRPNSSHFQWSWLARFEESAQSRPWARSFHTPGKK